MPYRRRAKRDANEGELVKMMRKLGAWWIPANVTDGPDGFIAHHGRIDAAEVKTEKGKLREGQAAYHQCWPGGKIHILRTVDDVIRLLT